MTQPEVAETPLFSLSFAQDWTVHATIHSGFLIAIALIAGVWVFFCLIRSRIGEAMEIDQAEIGTGNGKIHLKPNWTDRQVAYSIWVELSTRKIGLEIDFEHDVMVEVMDSWYAFFGITRDLLKTIPVQKVRNESTQKIVKLSIDVLNEGLRPALTKWQARYRRWYDKEIDHQKAADLSPQTIQQKFPQWPEMVSDIENVNKKLIAYRKKLRNLVD